MSDKMESKVTKLERDLDRLERRVSEISGSAGSEIEKLKRRVNDLEDKLKKSM